MTEDQAAPEVESTYARVPELGEQIGESRGVTPALWGLVQFYIAQAQFQRAHKVADRLCQMAAHQAVGAVSFHLGKFASARTHLEKGILLDEQRRGRASVLVYPADLGVGCRVFAGVTPWFLGPLS